MKEPARKSQRRRPRRRSGVGETQSPGVPDQEPGAEMDVRERPTKVGRRIKTYCKHETTEGSMIDVGGEESGGLRVSVDG